MRDRKAERKSRPGIHTCLQKHPTVETAGEPVKIQLDRQGHLLQQSRMHPAEITSLQRTVGNRAVLQTAPDDEKTFPADPYSLIPAGEAWDHESDKVGSAVNDVEGGPQEDGELDVPATGGATFSGLDEALEG